VILEIATLDIRPGQEAAFEAAMRLARPLIMASPGCLGMEVRPCLENSSRYLLLVQWRALEDHTIGFRQSAPYQEWCNLLHGFYDPVPTVEHYAPPLDLV
jgi:heme-degrading monooxygenase HmoA